MLTVYRKDYNNKRDRIIGYFETLENVYDFFIEHAGEFSPYVFGHCFSHDPYERTDNRTVRSFWGAYEVPEYCIVIKNHKEIRYSKEYIKSEFAKIRAKRSKSLSQCFYIQGTKRVHRGSYYKYPGMQERRLSLCVLEEEGEPKWRAKRNYRNLPTSWDDIYKQDTCNNNWKRYRKTQWK